MRLEKRRLEDLKEYENNPRIIDKAVPLVAAEIAEQIFNIATPGKK